MKEMRSRQTTWKTGLLILLLGSCISHAEDLHRLYREDYKEFFSQWKVRLSILAWSVTVPLYTLEDGLSDLTLELHLTRSPAMGYAIEVDNLQVP